MDAQGSAIALDFGELPGRRTIVLTPRRGLRLAPRVGRLQGPDKYRTLELRRRRAQIAARHALDLG